MGGFTNEPHDGGDLGDPVEDLGRPTDEEVEVMTLVVEGLSDHAIATRLGVSVTTVRRRARRFCERLAASTRIQAAMRAHRRGWL